MTRCQKHPGKIASVFVPEAEFEIVKHGQETRTVRMPGYVCPECAGKAGVEQSQAEYKKALKAELLKELKAELAQ